MTNSLDTPPIATQPSAARSSETDSSALARKLDILCGALAAAVVARLWIAPMRASLWLDEFGTWWITNGRFGEVLSRARLFPQSAAYMAVVWITRAVAGAGEIALRAPSLIAALICLWAMYRLGRELFDRDTGLLAAGVFVAFPPIVQAAHDARPYALAVLAVVLATWLLARWARGGRRADAAWYAAAASSVVYLQYFFAAVLPAHAAWILARHRARLRQALAVAAAIAALTLPAVLLVLEIGKTAPLHSYLEPPGLRSFVDELIPQRVLGPLLAGALVALVATRFRFTLPRGPEAWDSIALLILSMLVPVALLAVASETTGVVVFAGRYLMSIVPAQAMLLAWLARGIDSAAGRRAALAIYLAIVLVGRGLGPGPVREDWRGAAAAVRAANGGRPVLLDGGFIESRDVGIVRQPAHAAYMRSPLEYYDAGGRVIVLPLREEPRAADAYAEELLRGSGLEGGFALIARSSSRFPSWAPWLDARARARGLTMRQVWNNERVRAWVFERTGPS
jgi:mannosyltransferase